MRVKLFWRLGLAVLALLLMVLAAAGSYAARVLRRAYLRAAEDHLASVNRIIQKRPPNFDDVAALREWARWISESGARVTVITAGGLVLADSAHDPETMENHANRPEFLAAMATGEGESVRHSKTLDRDLVYRAARYPTAAGPPVIVRLAIPLGQVESALGEIRGRLLLASLLILVVMGSLSLLLSRQFSARVERLKDFSERAAAGDFRPISLERPDDALTELARTMNATAARLNETIHTLTRERNLSAAILSSMIEGVAVIDPAERVVFCNQAFAQILGGAAGLPAKVGASDGRPLVEVVRHADLLGTIRQALAKRESVSSEVSIGTVAPRSFSVTVSPVGAAEPGENAGASQGAVVVLHEITELRRLERVRQDFVANVSHEFKTPLTALQGFAETLLAGALEEPAHNRRFVEIMRDHAARLARLTDDLLKLSRIEAGKLELEFRSVSLAELIESCAKMATLQASQKQLALEIQYPPSLPWILGDASLLREILHNLLDNAVQYTPPGGRIELRVEVRGDEAVVTVADTGIGIAQTDQERIFERFYRVDAARSREVGGTGLGLAIAKHIVEVHRGRIWVESELGHGSAFHFSIPLFC